MLSARWQITSSDIAWMATSGWGRYIMCLVRWHFSRYCSFILHTLHMKCMSYSCYNYRINWTNLQPRLPLTFNPSQVHHRYGFHFHSRRLSSPPMNGKCIHYLPHNLTLPQGWRACWSLECRHACLPFSSAYSWWHGWTSHNSGVASAGVGILSPSCCRSHGVC